MRERVAEELAKKDTVGNKDLSDNIFGQMERLKNITLGSPNGGLLKLAERKQASVDRKIQVSGPKNGHTTLT